MVTVAALTDGLVDARDPTPALRWIQAEARRAMTELRRQLGLLRDAEAELAPDEPPVPDESWERPPRPA